MGKPQNTVAGEPNDGTNQLQQDWRIGEKGHPLKKWRKHKKISLDDLSFQTGISISSLSRIERFKQTPLISAAAKIILASDNFLRPEDFFYNDNI